MINARAQPPQAWTTPPRLPPQRRTEFTQHRPIIRESEFPQNWSTQRQTPPQTVFVRQPSRSYASSEPAHPSFLRDLGALAIKIVVISISFTLIFTFLYGFHRHSGPEMSPMIKDGDVVLFYRLDRAYDIGDLVLLDVQGQRQVRRVVAKAGDTVDITEDGLLINGGLQHEPDIFQETWRYANGITFPITVEEGQVFVLGDARQSAVDSREYGPVSTDNILGTVITVIRRRSL